MPRLSLYVRLLLTALWAFVGVRRVLGQQSSPSPSNTTSPSSDALEVAHQIAKNIVNNTSFTTLDLRTGTQLIWALAQQDMLSNTNISNETVATELDNIKLNSQGTITQNLTVGLAGIYAFLAYNSDELTNAQDVWMHQNSTLLKSDIQGQNSTAIQVGDIGMFIALSGYLYQATNDSKYLDSASRAAQCVLDNPSSGDFSSQNGTSNGSCTLLPGSAGAVIEGLALLAGLAKNETISRFVIEAVYNVTTSKAPSNDTQDSNASVPLNETQALFRGLFEAARWTNDSSTNKTIKQYMTSQLNSIQDSISNLSDLGASGNVQNPQDVDSAVSALSILDVAALYSMYKHNIRAQSRRYDYAYKFISSSLLFLFFRLSLSQPQRRFQPQLRSSDRCYRRWNRGRRPPTLLPNTLRCLPPFPSVARLSSGGNSKNTVSDLRREPNGQFADDASNQRCGTRALEDDIVASCAQQREFAGGCGWVAVTEFI
ncbi:hypothetical protein K488DRAFT_90721 [Vararia minispora EC-137]|uniref:Uncharacterized protein n=1 Tax=Vararia minispora EC-137 TaxID=1314806 RepID=A0ACB8Q785_9AGAM|nr:hypothetical protein K488DRAFT_90721 [Vararia minispora EC-137]